MTTTRTHPQTVDIEQRESISYFKLHDFDHTPSWKHYADDGFARFEIMQHNVAGWMTVTMHEGHSKGPIRQTMLTLTPEAARKLYEFLHERYGVSVQS